MELAELLDEIVQSLEQQALQAKAELAYWTSYAAYKEFMGE